MLYSLYGLKIRSQWPLSLTEADDSTNPDIEICGWDSSASLTVSEEVAGDSPSNIRRIYQRLTDGADYVCWTSQFEFLVSVDGRVIRARRLREFSSEESFQVYLLAQALSFSLLKMGVESYHMTAVEVCGKAVGFMGDSGAGKSSMAASFIRAGNRLITDDLLLLRPRGIEFLVYPGQPWIKLYPEMARDALGTTVEGIPMNSMTAKRIYPLDQSGFCHHPLPLAAIYCLDACVDAPPAGRGSIHPVTPGNAVIQLIKNSFNTTVTGAPRPRRQLEQAAAVVSAVPVRAITYKREVSQLAHLRELVLNDLENGGFRHPSSMAASCEGVVVSCQK